MSGTRKHSSRFIPKGTNFIAIMPIEQRPGATCTVENHCTTVQLNFVFPSPYSVDPTSATLKEGHCMQVTVTFKPASVGDFSGELTVRYGTGNVGSHTPNMM